MRDRDVPTVQTCGDDATGPPARLRHDVRLTRWHDRDAHTVASRQLLTEHALEIVLERRPRPLRERLADVRVLDPTCGSGAFLVYALERLSALRR